MRKTKLLYSLALAPLLLGGYDNIGQVADELTVQTLPQCAAGQFLIYRSGAVTCEAVVGSGVALPDCKTPGQLLTYTSNGELSQYSCTPKGSITLSVTDQTTITNLNTQITQIGTTIMALGTGTPVAARTFRGLTPTPVNGAMGGTKAASASCVTTFGAGATMCDAYSMYISLAAGKIDVTKDLNGAWVYLADWTSGTDSNFNISGIAAVVNGLSDNCAGYTVGTAGGGVFGTKFSMVVGTGNATDRVPKFANKTTCDTLLPVACCQ